MPLATRAFGEDASVHTERNRCKLVRPPSLEPACTPRRCCRNNGRTLERESCHQLAKRSNTSAEALALRRGLVRERTDNRRYLEIVSDLCCEERLLGTAEGVDNVEWLGGMITRDSRTQLGPVNE